MIEVEKKFKLTDEEEKRLIEGAEFLGEKILDDSYFDTTDYSLSVKDTWLRNRNGRWEIKIPMELNDNTMMNQYEEIEDEAGIASFLGFPADKSLAENLADHGYEKFCQFVSVRRKYSKDGFAIDLDAVNQPDFKYTIGEIELMVNEKSEMAQAVQKIMAFAEKNRLSIKHVNGKIREYLRLNKPAHHQALIDAGVIKDITA